MQQSLREDNSLLPNIIKKIPVFYGVENLLLLFVPILSPMTPFHAIESYVFKIHFNITLSTSVT
jgi:putative effector of murein hydrolase LrgA (UPF0299 family)